MFHPIASQLLFIAVTLLRTIDEVASTIDLVLEPRGRSRPVDEDSVRELAFDMLRVHDLENAEFEFPTPDDQQGAGSYTRLGSVEGEYLQDDEFDDFDNDGDNAAYWNAEQEAGIENPAEAGGEDA
jgi:hypothetical protein